MPLPAGWITRYRQIYPSASPNLMQLLFAVRSTALMLDNAFSARLALTGLTSARYHLLMVLWGRGEPISFSEVGAYLTVTRATVSALVEGLVQDGIVDRRADTTDRRNAMISLTDKGEETLKPLLDNNFKDMRVAFADFSEDEISQLLSLLAKFRSNAERLSNVVRSAPPVRRASKRC